MTTVTNNPANENQTTEKTQAFVCACCLGLFPAIYLIGVTVMSFLG
jgi:hypothetical protein